MRKLTLIICCTLLVSVKAFSDKRYDAIHSGVVWFDQNNREVNAHGACIVKEGNKYFLFGEYKSDTANVFTGFSCYSSTDLMNWKFERIVLAVQNNGLMGPNRIGERVKVMKCPTTGEFVMYMHSDNMQYKDPTIAYATCKTINGEYQLQGPLLFDSKPIRKWDMGTFQDSNGKGYLLIHHGFIYELASDYKSVKRLVVSQKQGGEAPAIFKSKGIYYWLSSGLSSWEKNDNTYLTATALEGPWTFRTNFAPEGSLTWNSQTTFVLPVANKKDTVWMFMGDRWSFPRQGSAATYVWQPIKINSTKILLPTYRESWKLNISEAAVEDVDSKAVSVFDKLKIIKGKWIRSKYQLMSNEKDAQLDITFNGTGIELNTQTNNQGGYAKVTIRNQKNELVLSSVIDLYSKRETSTKAFVSPKLKLGEYTLTIQVLGAHPTWTDKTKKKYGSTDNFVMLEDIYVTQ